MSIITTSITENITLKEVVAKAYQLKSDVLLSSVSFNKQPAVIAVIHGSDTKAFVQAINRINELIDEDKDVDIEFD